MLLSRGSLLLKAITNHVKKTPSINIKPIRLSSEGHFWYRTIGEADKTHTIMAEIAGGFLWWWVMWNMWHEWEHLVGHFRPPNASEWTNEELGVPSD